MALVEFIIPRIRQVSRIKGISARKPLRYYVRSYSSEKDGDSNFEQGYEENIKEKILESSLAFVNDRGWTTAAISEGARSIGYPGISHGMFSNPNLELIDYFNRKCNSSLNEALKKFLEDDTKNSPQNIVQNAVQIRLGMIIPYISRWPQAMAIMSSPTNIPVALSTFSELIDDICHFSGDKSVDFNWYSRRAAVALIYKSSELCLIQDKSLNHEDTWRFLERRVDQAFTVDKIIKTNETLAHNAKDLALASFTTMRNILGIGSSTR